LRILLVRHGRTAWNAQHRVLGRTDVPLDDVGEAQAARLPGAIGPVDAVWSSPLRRAVQTASTLGTPIPCAELVEMDQGELDGLGRPELLGRFGELVHRWRRDPAGIRLPGGETMEEVQQRGLTALTSVARAHHQGVVAVVTHQLVISATLCALHGEPLSSWTRFTVANTAWTVLEVGPLRVVSGPHDAHVSEGLPPG
jgi:probable phosphoglycerate mutase